MPRNYVTREDVKRTLRVDGDDRNAVIDEKCGSASDLAEQITNRRFIPVTELRYYNWPQRDGSARSLFLDADLLATTAITHKGDSAEALSNTILEPDNLGPPYHRVDIDRNSTDFFEADASTSQRSVRVTGRWAYSEDSEAAGTVDGSELASDATAVTFVCSNGALIDVLDTILVESESLLVTERTFAALGSVLINDGSVTASRTNKTITLDASHGVLAGETMRLDDEEMLVRVVATNDVHVDRAINGTDLAAHSNDTAVHVSRTLTVARGANGTTAATHADTTAISRYYPPRDVRAFVRARAIFEYTQELGGWTGQIGGGDGASESRENLLQKMEERLRKHYRRTARASV